jgi:hypothetical protein
MSYPLYKKHHAKKTHIHQQDITHTALTHMHTHTHTHTHTHNSHLTSSKYIVTAPLKIVKKNCYESTQRVS